ncbi:MAG: hypothetical protein JWN18_422 [Parcubacteria group bacterium]|nr:hypothetical protein [Parcubacteria group bacterium]
MNTGRSDNSLESFDRTKFIAKILAVIITTFAIFFAALFFPDHCYANCRISVYYIDRPQTWFELGVWFIASLAFSTYLVFFRKGKKLSLV